MSEGIVNTNGAADVRTDHQIVDDDAAIAFETRAGGGPRPYSLVIRSSWIVSFEFVLPACRVLHREGCPAQSPFPYRSV